MPETFNRRLTVQPRLGQPAAFTAALMLHGVAVAGLLLAQPAPKPAPPLDVAVEVILAMPALPEDEPEAPPVGVPLSAASADPAEDRHADPQPDTAVWQEPPGDAGSVPATPVAEASAADTGPAPFPEPAGTWTAEPLPVAAMPRDSPPAMPSAAAVAEPAPNLVPVAVQAPAQTQPRPAPLPVSAPRPVRSSRAPVRPPPPGTAQAPHLLPERPGPPTSATGSLAATASTVPLGARPAHNADHEAALEARIRDAVQAAVHYPAAARMMSLTGRARVQLDYRSGTANPALVQSAGVQMLDDAALSAARTAHYPPPPPDVGDRLLRLLVWVEFKPG